MSMDQYDWRIFGIEEYISKIMQNLGRILFRSEIERRGTNRASIQVKGPARITVYDIHIPDSVKIVDPSQYICTIWYPMDLVIHLDIVWGYMPVPVYNQIKEKWENSEKPFTTFSMPIRYITIPN